MPSHSIQVALSEALEVQGGPLSEPQIWGLLCQTAEALQDLFIKGKAHGRDEPRYLITPGTLLVCGNGRVRLGRTSFRDTKNANYVPPELYSASRSGRETSEEEFDKMYVYSLGMTMYSAVDYGLDPQEELNLSHSMDNLLCSMCEEESRDRIALVSVLESCASYAKRHMEVQSYSHYVIGLYKLVLGSADSLMFLDDSDDDDEDDYDQENSPQSAVSKSSRNSRHSDFTRSRTRSRSPYRKDDYPERSQLSSRESSLKHSKHSKRDKKAKRSYSDYYDKDSSNSSRNSRQRDFYSRSQLVPTRERVAQLGHADPTHLMDITLSGRGNVGHLHGDPYSRPPHMGLMSRGASSRSLKETYERLRDRRRKLAILRHGMNVEDYSINDAVSLSGLSSDIGDRRSMMSANSFNYGSYRPDLYPRFGSDVALRMGHDSSSERPDSSQSSEPQYPTKRPRGDGYTLEPRQYMGAAGLSPDFDYTDLDPTYRDPATWVGSKPNNKQARNSEGPYSEVVVNNKGNKNKKQKQKALPQSQKSYLGPEFVALANDPLTELNLPLNQNSKSSANREVLVILLNGQKLIIKCTVTSSGREVFDRVVTHLGLPEYHYFGITFTKEGEHYFIDSDTKLCKVAPPGWKELNKGQHRTVTFTIFFRVKFYIDNIALLRNELTRHLYYLQVRRDFLEERTHCTDDEAMELTAIALQAEYGDYNAEAFGRNYFRPDDYIGQRNRRHLGSSYIRDNLPEQHKRYQGMLEGEAEVAYLKAAQRIPEYGKHFYRVQRSKTDKTNTVWVGIGVQGVSLMEPREDTRYPTHRHPWPNTQKISFNRRKFSIQPKSEIEGMKMGKLTYYTDSYRKGRYLLQLSTDHHRFQMKMRSRASVAHLFHDDPISQRPPLALPAPGDEESDVDDFTDEEEDMEDEDEEEQPRRFVEEPYARVSRPVDVPDHMLVEDIMDQALGQQPSKQKPRAPPYHSPSPVPASQPMSLAAVHQQRLARQGQPRGQTPGAYVVDASIRSQDQVLSPFHNTLISDSLNERLDHLPSADEPERHVIDVILQKEPMYGIGIVIMGGENTNKLDLGIFVKSVIPGGPAERDGRIIPGDRIIAINGQSLEGVSQQKATEIIKKAPSKVELILSQVILNSDLKGNKKGISPPHKDKMRTGKENEVRSQNQNAHSNQRQPTTGTTQQNRTMMPDEESDITSSEQSDLEVSDLMPVTKTTPQKPQRNKPQYNPYEEVEFTPQQSQNFLPTSSQSPVRRTPQPLQQLGIDNKTNRSAEYARNAQEEMESSEDELSGMDVEPLSTQPPRLRTPARGDGNSEDEFSTPDIIKNTPQSQPVRPGSNFSTNTFSSPASMGGYETSTSAMSGSPGTTDHLKPGDQYELVLEKINGSIGLNVTGGVNTSVKYGGIYVKSMVPSGAAERSQMIKIGDRVIEVNGVSLIGVTHKQAVETLRNSPQMCKLVMERGEPHSGAKTDSPAMKSEASTALRTDTPLSLSGEIGSKMAATSPSTDSEALGKQDYAFVTPDSTFNVNLTKGSSGLGFSVLGGRDAHPTDMVRCVTRIKKIFPLGAAAQNGQLKVGDVILEVNGTRVKGLTHNETVNLLRTAPTNVKLLICRPSPLQLPPVVDMGRESPYEDPTSPKNFSPRPISATPNLAALKEADVINNKMFDLSRSSVTGSPASHLSTSPVKDTNKLSPVKSPNIADQSARSKSPGAASHLSPLPNEMETPRPESSLSESSAEVSEHSTIPHPHLEGSMNSLDVSHRQTPIGEVEHNVGESPISHASYSMSETTSRADSPEKIISRQESVQSKQEVPGPNVSKQSSKRSLPDTRGLSREASVKSDSRPPSSKISRSESATSESDFTSPPLTPTPVSGKQAPPLKPGEFDVTLIKPEGNGLGFTVAGGTVTTGDLYIKAVLQDPALSDGRLKTGDKLRLVNGEDVSKFSHFDAVQFLRHTPREVTIRACRLGKETENSLPSPGKKPQPSSMYPNESSESETEDEDSHWDGVEKKKSVTNLIQGFEESKSLIKPHNYNKNLNVSDTIDSSPERPNTKSPNKEDSLSSKDRSGSQWSVISGRTSTSSWGDVSLPLDDEKSGAKNIPQDLITIKLKKPANGGFGFGLVTGEKGGVYVKTITPNSVAAKDGNLLVGDKVLKVDGESVVGLTHQKVVAMLRNAEGKVELGVTRPQSKLDSTLEEDEADDENDDKNSETESEEESETDVESDLDSDALDLPDQSGYVPSTVSNKTGIRSPLDTTTGAEESEPDVRSPQLVVSPPLGETDEESFSAPPPLPNSRPPRVDQTPGMTTDEDDFLTSENVTGRNTPLLPKPPITATESSEESDSWDADSDIPLPEGGQRKQAKEYREEETEEEGSEEEEESEEEAEPEVKDNELPLEITDQWLQSVQLVTPGPSGQYTGKALQTVMAQLQTRIDRDDPIEEYKNLRQVKLTDNCDDGKMPENKSKNRYRNVLPYDSNRVILTGPSDYINASHINIPVGKDKHNYIACQGPLPQTVDDFWRMVWEYRVEVIAMVTLDTEGGKVKCHCYWPEDEDEPLQVEHRYEVSLNKEEILDNIHIRYITIHDLSSGKKQKTVHLNYTTWPDHGTPSSALPLLQYIRLIHLFHNNNPVVIHCSAGIGRTGALITIDTVLACVERDLQFDIYKIVCDLRKQRPGMIQTKDQYLFCYKAVLQALESIQQ